MKHCVDCKHYRSRSKTCRNPKLAQEDKVTGQMVQMYTFASVCRSADYPEEINICGSSGRWFEPLNNSEEKIMKTEQALNEVKHELLKATVKFPTWPTDPLHAVVVLNEEVGELNKAVLQCTYEPGKSTINDVRTEALQVAAMALRFIVSLDDYEYRECRQHRQTL